MTIGPDDLTRSWNNVGILQGFLRFLSRRLREFRLGSAEKSVGSLEELGQAFADGWLGYGDLVTVRGRLSRFAPIYFPVAYSPQIPGVLTGGQLLVETYPVPNPAPGAVGLRHIEGGVLAYLFPIELPGTPRITSPHHPDRLGTSENVLPLPYSRASPSIPVLIDDQQLKWLEDKVEISARIRPLDPDLEGQIAGSSEDFVRLHFHGFYRNEWFPDQGFMLDARSGGNGRIRQVDDPSPFLVSLAVEASFQSVLVQDEIEDVFNRTLDLMHFPHVSIEEGKDGSRANYTPAYLTPGGYQIVQVNKLPVALHLAYEKRVIQLSVVGPSDARLPVASEMLEKVITELSAELKRRDPAFRFDILFSSDRRFARKLVK